MVSDPIGHDYDVSRALQILIDKRGPLPALDIIHQIIKAWCHGSEYHAEAGIQLCQIFQTHGGFYESGKEPARKVAERVTGFGGIEALRIVYRAIEVIIGSQHTAAC